MDDAVSFKPNNQHDNFCLSVLVGGGKEDLSADNYREDLYRALRHDDDLEYSRIRSQVNNLKWLINSELDYDRDPRIMKSREPDAEFRLPLHVCAASGGVRCLPLLLRDGADIGQCDVGSCNILHTVIIACSMDRDNEDVYLQLIDLLLKGLDHEKHQTLTKQPNKSGYRPLELSVRLGTYGIFRYLTNRPGILVENSIDAGVNKYGLFNLTEYEDFKNRDRSLRSPLRLLIYLQEEDLRSFNKYQIYRMSILTKWMVYKLFRNLPFLLIWLVCRIAFFTILALIDPSTTLAVVYCGRIPAENRTDYGNLLCRYNVHTVDDLQQTLKYLNYSYVWGILILSVDIIELLACLMDKRRRRAYAGLYFPDTTFVAYTRFYRICQFILVAMCVASVPVAQVLKDDMVTLIHAAYTFKALYLPLMVMSLMFVLEMFPVFGLFAITLQQMITSMLVFTAFIAIVKLLFAQFMTAVAKQHGFTDMGTSVYELFKMEMGSSPFPDKPAPVFMIIHVVYYFISAILLLNYLIAVMSSLATNTAEDRQAVQMMRRLDIIFTVEERYGQWFWRLVHRIRGSPTIRLDAKM